MKVQFSIVGQVEPYGAVWVDLDAIPREGDVVSLPRLNQAETVVRTVVWYPTIPMLPLHFGWIASIRFAPDQSEREAAR